MSGVKEATIAAALGSGMIMSSTITWSACHGTLEAGLNFPAFYYHYRHQHYAVRTCGAEIKQTLHVRTLGAEMK